MVRSHGVLPAVVAAALLLLAAGVALMTLMAVGMAGHMDMMRRGTSGENQPAVVSTAREFTVEIRDFTFSPGNLTVSAGAKVTWINRDSAPHTATDRGGEWDTDNLGENESATLEFNTPGTFAYYCVYHPAMTARLIVT